MKLCRNTFLNINHKTHFRNVTVEEKKEPEEAEKVSTPPLSVETKEPPSTTKKGKGGRGTSPKPVKGGKGAKTAAPSPISVEERPSSVAESTSSAPRNPL